MENRISTPVASPSVDKKWYDNKVLTNVLVFLFFPVGLYALWKSDVFAKWWKITASVLIGLMVLGQMKGGSKSATASVEKKQAIKEEPKAAMATIGNVLKTDYFDVTLNGASTGDQIDTGNEYSDVQADAGNKFIILDVTFKNTDTESRMIMDGSIFINYNGKDYEFDKAETILAPGYGTMLDQINPLISKSTKLVYKVPAEIKGAAYWQPGRADSDQKFYVGNL